MMGTFEAKTKNDISLAPKLHCCTKQTTDIYIVTTFLPWVLPTGGVACAACLMAHIISSMRAPSSSYIRPDNKTYRQVLNWVGDGWGDNAGAAQVEKGA